MIALPSDWASRTYPLPLRYCGREHKVGEDAFHWSMTAKKTCPGHTVPCKSCYALKGNFRRPNVASSLELNDEARHAPDWVTRVTSQIAAQYIRYVRVHASGDFDSNEYINKWITIVTRRPDTMFWAYTRSWSELAATRAGEDMLPKLLVLARKPNFQLWFSCDAATGVPPKRVNVRRAYMAQHDNDIPRYDVDLMFRVKRTTKMITMGNKYVCPSERQRKPEGAKKVTCRDCQLCFDRVDWLDQKNQVLRGKQLPVLN